jgi:hypothetical protein
MRDPSRMINRMYLQKSDVGVFGEVFLDASIIQGHKSEFYF